MSGVERPVSKGQSSNRVDRGHTVNLAPLILGSKIGEIMRRSKDIHAYEMRDMRKK